MTQPEPTTPNRRRQRRQKSKGSTKVTCTAGKWGLGPNLARSVLDLSSTGACLVLSAALEKGQDVEVSLQGTWQVRPLKLPAQVVWCLAAADGTWCAGIRFQRNLEYSDLQALAYV
jgi:hypothetical protein